MSENPTLNPIGTVVEELRGEFPDLTVSSLRFFERLGLLTPRRTAGGHRLYSAEDVARVRQIKRWQKQRLSLAEISARLAAEPAVDGLDVVGLAFQDALILGEAERAAGLVRRAHEAGFAFPELAEQVFQPALQEIGRRWADGEVSVAQEHQASAVTRDLIVELGATTPRPETRRGTVLAACVAGETHEIGLKVIATSLDLLGWSVDYLGADLPADSLLQLIRERRPDLVILSVTLDSGLPQAAAVARSVRALPDDARPRLLIGGQAVDRRADVLSWPVDRAGGTLRSVLDWIQTQFPGPEPSRSAGPPV